MRPDGVAYSKGWFKAKRRSYADLLLLMLLGSLVALITAYVAEYGFGLKPCPLCLYQRIPYAVAVVFCGIGLCFLRYSWVIRPLLVLSFLAVLIGAGLAAYHVGVEQGIFAGLEECTSHLPSGTLTLEALKEQIMQATVAARCDKPAFTFLGLSMAGWNFLYAIGLSVLGMIRWWRG